MPTPSHHRHMGISNSIHELQQLRRGLIGLLRCHRCQASMRVLVAKSRRKTTEQPCLPFKSQGRLATTAPILTTNHIDVYFRAFIMVTSVWSSLNGSRASGCAMILRQDESLWAGCRVTPGITTSRVLRQKHFHLQNLKWRPKSETAVAEVHTVLMGQPLTWKSMTANMV